MEATLSKTVKVMDLLEEAEDSVLFGQSDDDEPGKFRVAAVILEKDQWVDMGQPALITVTIVPGDELNQPASTKPEGWKHQPGRCDACGGFTESDDAEWCAMCLSTGLDLEQMRRNRMGGTPDEPVITSAHGIGVDDLPYNNGWYTLPDGTKVRAGEVDEALENWRGANVGGMNADEAITQPVG